MSELRQDPTTREWIIIATERAKRSHDFVMPERIGLSKEKYCPSCPFCEGNETMTPPEELAYRKGGMANGPGWWVRVIPNKFSVLNPQGSVLRRKVDEFFLVMDGVGKHEVIIESNQHNLAIASMEEKQAEELIIAYRERYLVLREDSRYQLIMIFKNHGQGAGTSLEHPHSQIIAMPLIPANIREKLEVATSYYDDNGTCVYCDLIQREIQSEKRIIEEDDTFLVFEPFASSLPFETWIIPKQHQTSFGTISMGDAKKFARLLRRTLQRIFYGLNNPDFNYVFFNVPINDEGEDFYHWHLRILPRLTLPAGFEMGSGTYINICYPEENAEFLRKVRI